MTFSRRYPLWLLIPPSILGFSLSILFLSQVLQLSAQRWTALVMSVLAVYGFAAVGFFSLVSGEARRVEEAIASTRRVGEAMSRCMLRVELYSLFMWIGGAILFAAIATAVLLPTFLGFQYFFEAGLISAATAMAWNYWSGKRLLVREAADCPDISYSGRVFTFDKKIAMVFIGYFMIACGAMVHLVSSRVSTTLENLAIRSETARFETTFERANSAPRQDRETLGSLKAALPPAYSVAAINADGTSTSVGEQLDPDEILAIRKIGDGDSSQYIGPHVTKFRPLKNGSILAVSVPWAPYRNIPYQIAFYSVIIALLTTIIFAIATYFLSRDLSQPVQVLMNISSEMARGNFDRPVHVFSDDEVGELAESFRETRNNLRRLLGRISGSGATITDGVRVITGGTDSLIVRSREQNSLTTSSTEAVDSMRRGVGSVVSAVDKVSELTQDSSSRAVELQSSAEEIARSMDHLFQSVEKTSSSTAEMDASAREMATRTGFLARISEEVLTFVSEMESTADELRRNASSTADLSRKVEEDAQAGGTAVNDTVMGINLSQEMTQRAASVLAELQNSVGKISQILNVIEEIAEKTNLLSLNAAIIAAQAGEHGLGFTVVADEIRELAERTRGSTKEISGIIKAIQRGSREAMQAMDAGVSRVNDNVRVAQNAADSLTQILSSAARSYEMANRMSKALQEQAEASRHLHEVTSKMSDNITEMNRSTAEQARGTKLLAEESEKVRDIALQVKNSTEQQSLAGGGIAVAMEQIAGDVRSIRDLLQRQLDEADRVASASHSMLRIARENEQMAEAFTQTVKNLLSSGQEFETEVQRFRISEH